MIVFRHWHNLLDMERKTEDWHKNDIARELEELHEASGIIDKWSEYSDVVYTVTRGRWGGYKIQSPLNRRQFVYGAAYMFPKYTFRWLFFRQAGKKSGAKRKVTEVRNPQKLHKLEHIANKYDMPVEVFIARCKKQLRRWPLLK